MIPAVSVVIPLFNKAGTILRAIDSVLAQSAGSFELIVVDDGSTDRSAAIVAERADPRIRLITQSNGGPGAARNRGAAEARAPLLAFLDADDQWRPDFLAAAMAALEREPCCALYVCGYDSGAFRQARPNKVAELALGGPIAPPINLDGQALKRRLDALHSSCVAVRTQVFAKEGGFYDRERCTYGEDSYLWCRLLLNHDICWDPAEHVRFHVEDSALGFAVAKRERARPISIHARGLRRAILPESRDALDRLVAAFREADLAILRQSGARGAARALDRRYRLAGWRSRARRLVGRAAPAPTTTGYAMTQQISTPIWVLSLANAEARRQRFAARAQNAGTQWRFFDALTTIEPSLTYREEDAVLHHGRPMQPGEIGCYSSHVAIWKAFLATDERQIVVLEDDVLIDWPGLRMVAEQDIAALGYDYIRLYAKKPSRHRTIARNIFRHSLYLIEMYERAYGTQGYVLTRAGAEKFLAASKRILRPIDDQMDRYYEHGVRNLLIFPPLVLEESVYSDIGTTRFDTPGWSAETQALFEHDRKTEDRAYRKMRAKQVIRTMAGKVGIRW